jgi:acetyl esterase
VGYRLAPEHPFPEPVEDAHAAFRWALEAAPGLGCDADRIAVAGDSAGGNMAAGLCIALREGGERQPAMQALIYPVTDGIGEHRSRELFASGFLLTKADIDLFEDHYMPRRWMLDDPRASVLGADDLSALAPAYITTAGFDVLRDEGEAYAERLRQSGNRVAVRRHPGLIHGFANMTQVSRNARAATLELCGAIAMGLA